MIGPKECGNHNLGAQANVRHDSKRVGIAVDCESNKKRVVAIDHAQNRFGFNESQMLDGSDPSKKSR